jgi:hypothetical protein
VSSDSAIPHRPAAPQEGDVFYDASFGARGGRLVRIESGVEREVTGLRISADAQLQLPSGAALAFEHDIHIAGRLLVQGTAENALSLEARQLVVSSSGRIEVPQDAAEQHVLLHARGTLLVAGTVNAAGGRAGASGAHVSLHGAAEVLLTGSVDVSGAAADDVGGAGGSVRTSAGTPRVWSSAIIRARGGDGSVQGGAGGTVVLGGHPSEPNAQPLSLRHTGLLDVSGGAQAGPCAGEACEGGAGGQVQLVAVGESLLSTGELRADGGASHTTGGQGGALWLRLLAPALGPSAPDARLVRTGDVFARGGAGEGPLAHAGSGGALTFQDCSAGQTAADFVGYRAIVLAGGAADTSAGTGGDGGRMEARASDLGSEVRRLYLHVPLTAPGGSAARGGAGGALVLALSELAQATGVAKHALPSWIPAAIVAGEHVLDGGRGSLQAGGAAGSARLLVRGSLELRDSVSAQGGAGSSAAHGGTIEASSSNALTLAGDVTVDGGDSSAQTGSGGCIVPEGRTLALTGSAAARGGDGGASTSGGPGGTIRYVSRDEPAMLGGTLDVRGGAGAPMGSAGSASSEVPSCTMAARAAAHERVTAPVRLRR